MAAVFYLLKLSSCCFDFYKHNQHEQHADDMQLQSFFLLVSLCLTYATASLQQTWDDRWDVLRNNYRPGYDVVAKIRGMLSWREGFSVKRSNHVEEHSHNDDTFPQIHWLNSTEVHDSPVIDGRWQIANVSIPQDWLCIKLSEPKAEDGSQKYACMPQAYFARWFEASLHADNKLSTAAVIGVIILLITILVAVGALSWKTRMVWLARKKAHCRRHNARRTNVDVTASNTENPRRDALELTPTEDPFADPKPAGPSS